MGKYGEFLYGEQTYGVGQGPYKKQFVYKVYDNGSFVTTWVNDVISLPSFPTGINSGPGQLNIRLARTFDNYGEDVDVKLNNRVDCYVYDQDETEGSLLYRGYISEFAPVLNGGREYISITLLPYSAELTRFMLREANGDTEVPFLSQDPADIFRGVISRYQADGGTLGSTTASVQDTGTVVSYTFNTNTVKEAFDKVVELCPEGYYWSIDPDGTCNLKLKPTGVTHDLSIGKHIVAMEPIKRVEGMINRVYFTGGGEPPLYKIYERTSSIANFGLYAKRITDQRVTDTTTAQTIATRLLDELDEPEVRTRLVIADNGIDVGQQGYNIESIKVGDTVRIKNLNFGNKSESIWDQAVWDVDVWDQTLSSVAGNAQLVVKTIYKATTIEIETSSRFPIVSKRIEDINRNLEATQTKDNPTTPS